MSAQPKNPPRSGPLLIPPLLMSIISYLDICRNLLPGLPAPSPTLRQPLRLQADQVYQMMSHPCSKPLASHNPSLQAPSDLTPEISAHRRPQPPRAHATAATPASVAAPERSRPFPSRNLYTCCSLCLEHSHSSCLGGLASTPRSSLPKCHPIRSSTTSPITLSHCLLHSTSRHHPLSYLF